MTYHIVTTQPSIFESFLKTGLIARGIENKIIDVKIHSLYNFAARQTRTIDDSPYGGGPGMVLRVDIMDKALSKLKTKA